MTEETEIQKDILLGASRRGYTVFRQNTGTGWTGSRVTRNHDGSVTIMDARPLHAGLIEGSSDLIGWRPILIGPEHVGNTLAQFVAIEVKTPKTIKTARKRMGEPPGPGSRRRKDTLDAQITFIRAVVNDGGYGIFTADPADVEVIPTELTPK